ncbi:MAG: AI-2E family transporter [Thermodesulfobacteria bacterium]|nr:AI-2E family transporter [Thermodesulfobacteriota bacterium]
MSRNILSTIIGFLLAGIVIFLTVRLYLPFFQPIAWAAVLALFLHPVNRMLRKLLKGRRGLAAILLCLAFIAFVFVPLVFAVTSLTSQAIDLLTEIKTRLEAGTLIVSLTPNPEKYPRLYSLGRFFFERLEIYQKDIQTALLSAASAAGQFLLSRGTTIFRNTVNLILQVIFMVFTLFYLFRDGELFVAGIKRLLPVSEEEANRIVEKVQQVIEATLYGSILTALAQGGLALLIYLILGVNSPLLLGLLTALASFIPLVGTAIVWLPIVIGLAVSGSYIKAAILLAYGSLIIGQIDSLIRPYFIGGRTEIHNLFIFFSILGGLKFFGFLGVFLGPILVALTLSILEIYRQKLIEENNARIAGSGDY